MEIKYRLLDSGIAEKFGVFPKYVMMECYECGKTWGIKLDAGRGITKRELICQRCAAEKMLEFQEKELDNENKKIRIL